MTWKMLNGFLNALLGGHPSKFVFPLKDSPSIENAPGCFRSMNLRVGIKLVERVKKCSSQSGIIFLSENPRERTISVPPQNLEFSLMYLIIILKRTEE